MSQSCCFLHYRNCQSSYCCSFLVAVRQSRRIEPGTKQHRFFFFLLFLPFSYEGNFPGVSIGTDTQPGCVGFSLAVFSAEQGLLGALYPNCLWGRTPVFPLGVLREVLFTLRWYTCSSRTKEMVLVTVCPTGAFAGTPLPKPCQRPGVLYMGHTDCRNFLHQLEQSLNKKPDSLT